MRPVPQQYNHACSTDSILSDIVCAVLDLDSRDLVLLQETSSFYLVCVSLFTVGKQRYNDIHLQETRVGCFRDLLTRITPV